MFGGLRREGAERLAVVSSAGADATSALLYLRVKGEMEEAVRQLGYASLVIARPSLLRGDRAATGQPSRPTERLAARVLPWLAPLLPASLRPIDADAVAAALREAVLGGRPGVQVLEPAALQALAASGVTSAGTALG